MYKRLLVAIDGSEPSYKALDHAVALAEKFGSELKILAVVPITNYAFLSMEGAQTEYSIQIYQDKINSFFNALLTDAEAMIRSKHADFKVSTILMEGRPSAIIVDVAEKEECDMIIMGSRGMGGIMGLMLGSTSHKVTNSCKKPVMIVK